jgi:perosamine synthetase
MLTATGSTDRTLRDRYEAALVRLLNGTDVFAFANARTALACVLRAMELSSGDEVLLSPLTCKVVPLTLLSMGLVPRYVDVSEATLNLDAAAVAGAAGRRTRAILFQHTYGSPAGLDSVRRAAATAALPLVEDRAQCLPLARPAADDAGSVASVFSTNLLKPLPAGSGGFAIAHDADLGGAIRAQREQYPAASAVDSLALRVAALVHDHVLSPVTYWPMLALYSRIGGNYRARPVASEIASEITRAATQAGAVQLKRGLASICSIELVAELRQAHVSAYQAALDRIDRVEVPAAVGMTLPLYYFPVRVGRKSLLLERARRARMEVVAWPGTTPIYGVEDPGRLQMYGYVPGSCPVAERVASTLVGLPTHAGVTDAHRSRIIELVRGVAE